MQEIQDSGKIWCKGTTGPVHAVRAGNKIFATGKEEDQSIECWVDNGILCVDLHGVGIRLARKFPLDLEPTLSGSLFNGFTKTKHADVKIVSTKQDRVEERVVMSDTYTSGLFSTMNSQDFWALIWQDI